MQIIVQSMTQSDFDAWVARQKAAAASPPPG
jgi:heme/copper-type cytochrome/quinol oxidase subunit 2